VRFSRCCALAGINVAGEEVEQIAEVLRKRLGDGDMYTHVGANVLVALNPYQPVAKVGGAVRRRERGHALTPVPA
jgi:hypothetical protein